ncbi:hypothetical protein JXA47_03445 [Candidatus Sumerlaeota bacterium]|nr:hypothetical protein [Candidatus Sumerlaeota bacterium]
MQSAIRIFLALALSLTGGGAWAIDIIVEDFASGDNGTLPTSLTGEWDPGVDLIVQDLATLGIPADHTGGDGYALQVADLGEGGYNFVYPASTANDTTTDQTISSWIYYDSTLNSGNETDWGVFVRSSVRPAFYGDGTGDSREAYWFLVTHDSSWGSYVPTDAHAFILKRSGGAWVQLGSEGTTALSDGWHEMTLTAEGSTISGYIDGVLEVQATDTDFTAGYAGLVAYLGSNTTDVIVHDNFTWTAPDPTPPPQTALEPPFELIGSFPTALPPLAIATDGSSLYYATFTGVAATPEAAYYIASPEDEIGGSDVLDHVLIATEASFPATRGFQGIGVDSSGNVYLSGDDGTAPGVLLKFGPAPTFTPDATFNANAVTNGTNRWGGLALLGDDAVAVAYFNSINYFAAADASVAGFTNVGGGVNYQREPVYNAADNVIYALRNGNSDPTILAGLYEGGTTTTGNYTFTSSVLIADGAVASTYGTATAHGFVDNSVSPPRLYTVDSQAVASGGSDPLVRVWEIGAGGDTLTLLGSINSALGGTGWTSISDCVVIGNYLYVSSNLDQTIYVYGGAGATAVGDYSLYR